MANDFKDIPPAATGRAFPLSKEEFEALQSKVKETRNQALLGLQKTGAVIDFTTDKNRIKVIVDSLEIEIIEDGTFTVKVDDHDVSASVKGINISASRNNFPHVTIMFQPKISFVKKGGNGLVL